MHFVMFSPEMISWHSSKQSRKVPFSCLSWQNGVLIFNFLLIFIWKIYSCNFNLYPFGYYNSYYIHNNNLHFLFYKFSPFPVLLLYLLPMAAKHILSLRSRKSHYYPFLRLHLAKIKIHWEKQWRYDPQFMSPQTLKQLCCFGGTHAPFLSAKVLRLIC